MKLKFIDKGRHVQVQVANQKLPQVWSILADFEIPKEHFEEFLDHVIKECKKAYGRDDLFP